MPFYSEVICVKVKGGKKTLWTAKHPDYDWLIGEGPSGDSAIEDLEGKVKLFKIKLQRLVPHRSSSMRPAIGESIYIRSSSYIDHGEDDVAGGMATISEVRLSTSGGEPTYFVSVREIPGASYNYTMLLQEQDNLRKQFGNQKAKLK